MPLPTFADAGGLSLHHRLRGPANAAHTLVFINSLGSDLRIWDEVGEGLSGRFRTLQYDKRGHGLSDTAPMPYILRDHTGDLAALLDSLKIDQVVLIGVSVGGLIAQDFAAAFPARVQGLVLCDSGLKIGVADAWNERIAAAQDGDLSRVAAGAMGRWFTPSFAEAQPAAVRGYLNMLARTTPEGYGGTCAVLRDTDLRDQTAALSVPAVVLCGAEDTSTTPELNRELAAALRCDFRLIPDAAHLPSVEQPDVVRRHIEEFVASLGGGADDGVRDGAASARFEAGMRIRRQVLGAAHVDRVSAGVSHLDRDFQTFITEYAWGGPWSRGVLDTHTRHLITLAVLTALPREHELELHIRATANTAVTPQELREVFMQVAVYAGVPVANRAFEVAKRVLDHAAKLTPVSREEP